MSEEKGEILLEVRRLKPNQFQIIFGGFVVVLIALIGSFSSVSFLESLFLLVCAIGLSFHLFAWFFMYHNNPDIIIYSNGVKAKKLSWLDNSFISWSEIRSIHLRHYARGSSFVILMPFESNFYWGIARFRDVDLRDKLYHKTPLSFIVAAKWAKHHDYDSKTVFSICENAMNVYHQKHGIKG